jgi:hypothetical protein
MRDARLSLVERDSQENVVAIPKASTVAHIIEDWVLLVGVFRKRITDRWRRDSLPAPKPN